jgi:hypothetical protein
MLNHLTLSQIERISALAERTAEARSYEDRRVAHLDLRRAIEGLTFEARIELKALMWVGRGDDLTFRGALEHGRWHADQGDAGYIAAKSPALPTYLRDGLTEIGMSWEGSGPGAPQHDQAGMMIEWPG